MLQTLFVLVALAALFAIIERLAPIVGTRRDWRSSGSDIAWFFTAPVVRLAARGATVALVVVVAVILGWEVSPDTVGFGPLGAQPGWVQAIQILVLSDLCGYALHRAFHTVPWLWRIHAVHHSSERLDWLAATRVHPLNTVLTTPVRTLPLVLVGYDPSALAAAVPILSLYAVFLHSDFRGRFGPVRHVVATPAFHRWHHAAGVRANYGGLLTIWDRVAGTLHLPQTDAQAFGVDDEHVPEGFWAQLLHPLRPPTTGR